MTNILIVEDSEDLAFGLRNNLEFEGYDVSVVHDGKTGLEMASGRTVGSRQKPVQPILLALFLWRQRCCRNLSKGGRLIGNTPQVSAGTNQ